jgi:hypothetical protein
MNVHHAAASSVAATHKTEDQWSMRSCKECIVHSRIWITHFHLTRIHVDGEHLEKTAGYERDETIYWHAVMKIADQIWVAIMRLLLGGVHYNLAWYNFGAYRTAVVHILYEIQIEYNNFFQKRVILQKIYTWGSNPIVKNAI